ncbi:hypothetical protein SDC9_187512 [bioreactor metagenome]|uniref:Uncharacterized protein n=1 Tax=bioreactor metagenome TaxID=1076179 RepID=A0A645HM22_9ZZZZ
MQRRTASRAPRMRQHIPQNCAANFADEAEIAAPPQLADHHRRRFRHNGMICQLLNRAYRSDIGFAHRPKDRESIVRDGFGRGIHPCALRRRHKVNSRPGNGRNPQPALSAPHPSPAARDPLRTCRDAGISPPAYR